MLHKRTTLIIWSVVIAVLWYVTTGVLGLMLDNDKPHPLLEAVFSFMLFPVSYLPGWETFDSRTAVMSFRTWCWYSNIGGVLNCLLWGFFLVWIYRLVARLFVVKNGVPAGSK